SARPPACAPEKTNLGRSAKTNLGRSVGPKRTSDGPSAQKTNLGRSVGPKTNLGRSVGPKTNLGRSVGPKTNLGRSVKRSEVRFGGTSEVRFVGTVRGSFWPTSRSCSSGRRILPGKVGCPPAPGARSHSRAGTRRGQRHPR